jgi:hypothetical protein
MEALRQAAPASLISLALQTPLQQRRMWLLLRLLRRCGCCWDLLQAC